MTEELNAKDRLSAVERGLIEELESMTMCITGKQTHFPESTWKFWFDAAKGSTPKEVREVIRNWTRSSTRAMTPADLRKALSSSHAQKRAIEESRSPEEQHDPIPANESNAIVLAMRAATKKSIPDDAGARRNRIKEAYGFFLTNFVRQSWRNILGIPEGYNFEDTEGVFPLSDVPDERRSLYHDSHIHFIREYEARHGLELVFDKELATKRYPTMPHRWTSAAQSVGVKDEF